MKIKINLEKNSYFVNINSKASLEFNSCVAIVSNETVAALHLRELLFKIKAKKILQIILKDGEEYKNMSSINFILDQLLKANFSRHDTIIGFGGGVVTDMAGFAASIYLRGVAFVNIPTTMLACTDAAVGGKTGVNTKYGKNLIGSFYQPKAVYIYTDFLKTLSKKEYLNGVIEAVKMAVMFDKDFFIELEKGLSTSKIIQKSVEIKASVVQKDEHEAKLRKLLNYGHTFAHVIEKLSCFSLPHGEAVGMGMILANSLALKLGILKPKDATRINELLKSFEIKSYEVKNPKEFYELFLYDKKTKDGKTSFILAKSIGKGLIYEPKKEDLMGILGKSGG